VLKAIIINNFSPHSHKEGPVYITLSKQKKPVSGIRFLHKATPLSPKQQLPLPNSMNIKPNRTQMPNFFFSFSATTDQLGNGEFESNQEE